MTNRILWFFGIAPTKLGGLEIFAARMAAMHPSIHFTFCFTTDPTDKVRAAFPANADFATIADQTGFKSASVSAIRKLLKQTKPDIVVYSLGGPIRPLPWLAKLAGARVVYMDETSRTRDFRTHGAAGVAQRFLAKPISLVIAASEYTRQVGVRENTFNCPTMTVPNGVDPNRSRVSGADFRAKYGIPAAAKLVTQCSWLTPDKGVDLFIGAARQLANADTWFLIAGDGSHRAEYEKMSEGLNIVFTGQIEDPMAEGLYAASNIFCLPSRWQEACGLVNIEAMAFGVPVVASRIGGIPEFVADGVAGLLIEPTVEDITAKLSRLLTDDDLRNTLGANARERAIDLFTVDDMVRGYSKGLGLQTA